MVGSALPGLGFLRRLPRLALDVVLPPQCLGCEAIVDEVGALCPRCWNAIQFIAEPVCGACGVPFAYALGGNALCGACVREQPAFARARAAFVYDDASRRLVLAFKHADRTDAAPAFAEWMARAGAELLADAHVIAPVPLHWTRLFRRRYNQAALLAAALGAKAGVPVAPELIVRRRRTRSQGGLGPSARRRNLAGAFAAPPGGADAIADRRVLLVDDVLTTGATAGACSQALLKSGAAAVDVLTLARVVRPTL